jgi:hypothetical protein
MPKPVALNWARRLKRVLGGEIKQCARRGGRLQVIASIEEAELIERVLAHLREQEGEEALHFGRSALRGKYPSSATFGHTESIRSGN